MTLRASVVVATHNRAHLLERLVDAVAAQSVPPHELVIVDDASTDSTPEVLEKLEAGSPVPLRVLRLERNAGPATARNRGWRAASGDVVAFTDDDCIPQPGWLAGLIAPMGAGVDIVQGRTMPDPDQLDRHGSFSRTLEVSEERGFYETCNIAYRRAVLEDVGGFDERFRHPTGEDTDLAWRARARGARTTFAADAVVHHDVRPSSYLAHLADTWRWEGVVLAVREHPDLRSMLHKKWFWKQSHPPALLAGVGMLTAATSRSPAVRAAGVACLIPYLRFRTRVAPVRGRRRHWPVLVPLALGADLAEVAVLAVASVRYRSLLL